MRRERGERKGAPRKPEEKKVGGKRGEFELNTNLLLQGLLSQILGLGLSGKETGE